MRQIDATNLEIRTQLTFGTEIVITESVNRLRGDHWEHRRLAGPALEKIECVVSPKLCRRDA
jgi:hypothetical protein